jgi:hypothetical protein
MEQEALNEAFGTGGDGSTAVTVDAKPSTRSSGSPATISEGQTIEQVVAILGNPKSIFSVGRKTIYLYQDAKITFLDRKVSDVQ